MGLAAVTWNPVVNIRFKSHDSNYVINSTVVAGINNWTTSVKLIMVLNLLSETPNLKDVDPIYITSIQFAIFNRYYTSFALCEYLNQSSAWGWKNIKFYFNKL